MPAVNSAPAGASHVPDELLAAVRAVVAEVVARPKPLLIPQVDVPAFVGVSRWAWYRLRSEGVARTP